MSNEADQNLEQSMAIIVDEIPIPSQQELVKTFNKSTLYCSFCGKSQHEVVMLIAGPTVFICDECVVLSVLMLKNKYPKTFVENMIEQTKYMKQHPEIYGEINES